MRILSVRFQNINSLKGQFHIDFDSEPLKSAGLFAITGPTGAGKSTLLDIITLALFCQTPRSGKITRTSVVDAGSILSKHTQEAWAEVDYACTSGRFRSKWSIRYNRNGNLNEHEMELWDLNSGTLLDLKKSEVPAKNEAIIGLSYVHFTKAILLAQGQFESFLKADKKERGQLLEQISGIDIYRTLSQMAFERNREAEQSLKQLRRLIEEQQQQLLPESEYAELQAALQKAEQQENAWVKELQSLKEAQVLKQEISRLAAQMQKLSEAVAQNQQQQADFQQQNGQAMQQHQALLPYRSRLVAWQQQQTQKAKLERQKHQFEQARQSAEIRCGQTLESVSRLLGTTAQPSEVSKQLAKFKAELDALNLQINQLRDKYKSRKSQVEPLLSRAGLITNKKLGEAGEIRTVLSAHLAQESHKLETLIQALPTTLRNEPKIAQQNLRLQASSAQTWQQKAEEAAQQAQALETLTQQLQGYEQERQALPAQCKIAQLEVEKADAAISLAKKEYENRLLRANLEELRGKLSSGEPCPLCGATEHPFAESLPPSDPSDAEQQLTAQRKTRDQWQQKFIALSEQLRQAEKLYKKLSEELAAKRVLRQNILQQAAQAQHALTAELAALTPEAARQKIAQQAAQLDEFIELKQSLEQLKPCMAWLEEMEQISLEGLQFTEALKRQYEPANWGGKSYVECCEQLTDNWQKAAQAVEQQRVLLQENQKALADTCMLLEELQSQLDASLQNLGYPSPQTALANLLEDMAFAQMQEEVQRLTGEYNNLQGQLSSLHVQLAEKRTHEHPDPMEALQQASDALEAEITALKTQKNQWQAQKVTHQAALNRLEQHQKILAQERSKNKKWGLLNQMIGSATGDKFANFAQELTLQQLTQLANRRLATLNPRYRLLLNASEKNDTTLQVADLDMGGISRSVKTLSGGETFLISLALALGLSDLASQQVRIESLFIDEGFGTLDPLTLDQTLDTLERLQAESNRCIGVISHVEAMKERINTRIELRPNGQGYSSLHIVSGGES